MKLTRLLPGVLLLGLLAACTNLPALPSIPPGWTRTPALPPTETPAPIPTATSTPLPIVRVENGDHALFNGEYDLAAAHYLAAYQDSSDPNVRAAAKWGEARTFYADGRYPEALAAAQTLVSEFPDSVHAPDGYMLEGLAQNEMKHYQEAAAAWQTYLEKRPGVIDSFVQELRGDVLSTAGSYTDALAAYEAALQAPRLGDGIEVDLKVGKTQADLGQYADAIARYDGIAARTTNDYLKAQVAYLTGQAYQGLGQSEEAYGKYRLAVEQYPLSYYSYLSLTELVDAQVQVSDLDRGIVDYYAGVYDKALERLDLYLSATPVNDGTAHYYRALTLRELGNYQAAVDEFTTFITNYATHPRWTEAWQDKAEIQWVNLDLYSDAARTLTDYVAVFPNSSSAVDFLMSAARILERDNQLDEAIALWQRVASEYASNKQAATGAFLAGITRYRQSNFAAALEAFNQSLSLALDAEDQARAYLWIGKAQQQLGHIEDMQKAWQQGQATDPGGYYSERARDLMTATTPFAPPASSHMSYDLAAERQSADTWMRLTFNLPDGTDLTGLGPLAQDPRAIRGTALWNIGLWDDARLEFEDLREAVSGSAVDSYRLGNYLLDLGLYRPAIFAVRQTLTLAGLDQHTESMMAPPYFSHVRYGLYYNDLIIPDAQAEGLDPLFVFSMVRQESLFEGFVRSTAGARGLMQIIPSTAANIAGELGWPFDFVEDDLYRPDVSIRFGTHYYAQNLRQIGGDPFEALAAYNAGPGNAMAWKDLSGGDPDLYLEVIRFDETRTYIRNIYEIFVIYRRLYGSS
ncbi:MAG: tetratricopeptide repeat protein [Bacteroidota bacterium]